MSNEIFEEAMFLMRLAATTSAMGYEYRKHWSSDFRIKEINEFFEKKKESLGADFWNAVFQLPDEQKQMLGFCKWCKEEKEMCIPIWIWACLPEDMPIGGNGGGKMKKDLDSDTRFGCVWWRV